MKFQIVEFDKDYHAVTDTKIMNFNSQKEADEYCRKESWSGYSYHAYPDSEWNSREYE